MSGSGVGCAVVDVVCVGEVVVAAVALFGEAEPFDAEAAMTTLGLAVSNISMNVSVSSTDLERME